MAETFSDQEFVEYVLKAILKHPDDIKVTRMVDELGVLISVEVNDEDMGTIIGKSGQTAKSIRTILRVIGSKNNARVNFKIIDLTKDQNEGAPAPTAKEEPAPAEEEKKEEPAAEEESAPEEEEEKKGLDADLENIDA